MANESKDYVLSLNLDIMKEIKENEKYAKSKDGKKKLQVLKEELEDTKQTFRNMGIKEDDIPESVQALQNEINWLKGDDYWFTVSDGFEDYKLRISAIEKMGDQVAPYILSRWKDNVQDGLDEILSDPMNSQQYKEKLDDSLRRLIVNIKRNIALIRKKSTYAYDNYLLAKSMNEPYPIFQDVNALNIRINI